MSASLTPTSGFGLALTSAFLGLSSHLLYFIRSDHPFYHVTFIFLCFLIVPTISVPLLIQVAKLTIYEALYTVIVTFWSFTGAIWLSMGIYRGFFHRLGGYPGPFAAKFSQFWRSGRNISKQPYLVLDELHKKYGDYVRTGPSEISIVDPEAIELVLGSKSKCLKSIFYDVNLPMTSLHQTRDKTAHAQRRRDGWDKAFNASSLRNYEGRVLKYTDLLVDQLSKKDGEPVNMSQWSYFFGFDIMGDLAFGKSFNMLATGKPHHVVSLLKNATAPLGVLSPIVWVIPIIGNIIGGPIAQFLTWCGEHAEMRKTMKVERPDIMTYLLEAPSAQRFTASEAKNWLWGDSRLIVIAGSDTTTTTIAFTCYFLAKYPAVAEKLRAELQEAKYAANPTDLSILQRLPYVNGFIDETLRLHPPVPGGVYRVTPPEGLQIGDHFIPGDITILTPNWSIQRSPTSFVKPLEMIPERWFSQPELILNKAAFIPFGIGIYGCIGKQLAYMELRAVIAKLVLNFDIEFAPGEDGRKLIEESKDAFTMLVADLYLSLKPRGVKV